MGWIVLGWLRAIRVEAADRVGVIHRTSRAAWPVDRESVTPAHAGIRAGFRYTADHTLLTQSGGDDRSGRTQRVVDGRGGRSADLADDGYKAPGWQGPVGRAEQSDAGHPHWTAPRPGCIGDAPMAFVCDYASRADSTTR